MSTTSRGCCWRLFRALPQPDIASSSPDGRPGGWPHRELAQAIGDAVGRKVRVPQLSKRVLLGAARVDRLVRRGRAKLTADRVGYMTHPDWVGRPEHAVPAEFWQPWIATADGLKDTAGWYRQHGWL